MSLVIHDQSLFVKNSDTNEFIPISMFSSGADQALNQIAEAAQAAKDGVDDAINEKMTQVLSTVDSTVTTKVNQALLDADTKINNKIDEVLADTNYGQLSSEVDGLSESITELKDDLKYLLGSSVTHITDLSTFDRNNGFCTTSNTWGAINDEYQFVAIPVDGGNIRITANADFSGYLCGVKTYSNPVNGELINTSGVAPFNARINLAKSTQKEWTIPADVKYLLVWVKYNGNDCTPQLFDYSSGEASDGIIPGMLEDIQTANTILPGLVIKVNDTATDCAATKLAVFGTEPVEITDISAYPSEQGWINTSKVWNNINDNYNFVVIPATGIARVAITGHSANTGYIAGLVSYTAPVPNSAVAYSAASGWTSNKSVVAGRSYEYDIPADVKYLLVWVKYNGNDCTPASFSLNIAGEPGITEKMNPYYTVKYLALGDSITEGFYSTPGQSSDTEVNKTADCYVNWIGRMKKWDTTNKGVGGSGWLKRGTAAAPKLNAREQIDSGMIDFTQYDVVTMLWGVNDWKGSQNFGMFEDGTDPTTESVIGNMRYCIERILAINPAIKLIMITPINCRQDTSSRPSTADNEYGIGYQFGGKTLEDYYNAMRQVCDYYNIELIDMLHNSAINRQNAVTLLPDKVHPSLAAHKLIGLDLAGKILFGS